MGLYMDLLCIDKQIGNGHVFGLIVAQIARGLRFEQDLVN